MHIYYRNLLLISLFLYAATDWPSAMCQFGSLMFPSYGNFNPYGNPLGFQPPVRQPSPFSNNFAQPPYSPWSRPSLGAFPGLSYPQNNPPVARPASPARLCRTSGACKELDHGTTLATTWRIRTTTPAPIVRLYHKATTNPGLDRSDRIPETNTTVVASGTKPSNLKPTPVALNPINTTNQNLTTAAPILTPSSPTIIKNDTLLSSSTTITNITSSSNSRNF